MLKNYKELKVWQKSSLETAVLITLNVYRELLCSPVCRLTYLSVLHEVRKLNLNFDHFTEYAMNGLKRYIKTIDRINEKTGMFAGWLTTLRMAHF